MISTVRSLFSFFKKTLSITIQTMVRFIGTPFQRFLDKAGDTHRFLTHQSLTVLKNDGYREASEFFSTFKDVLTEGNLWADRLWKNAFHHYNPKTGKGLLIWPGGQDQCKNWFDTALSNWKAGRLRKAMFMLGAATHIVQDLCQPYHANCRIFSGHQKYEQWVDLNKHLFAVDRGGIYNLSDAPQGWAVLNALFSQDHISSVTKAGEHPDKVASTRILLERAQRASAGFLMFFLEQAEALRDSPAISDDFFQKTLTHMVAD